MPTPDWPAEVLCSQVVRPSVRLSVTKLVNVMFWKRIIQFWCKLVQVVYGAKAWNSQLWGSGSQRSGFQISRPHKAIVGHGNSFCQDLSRTIWRSLTKSDIPLTSTWSHLRRDVVLCYSIVHYYNGAQRYEQFLQVGRLYRALLLLGLTLWLTSTSVSSVFMMLYRY